MKSTHLVEYAIVRTIDHATCAVISDSGENNISMLMARSYSILRQSLLSTYLYGFFFL